MRKTIVCRPVNGIMINGELEFLLDDCGKVKVFDGPEQAKSFLIVNGVDVEELRHMSIMDGRIACLPLDID